MKSRLLTLFIFWAVCSISHSANVNFANMRLTWDQIDSNNGRTMLQLHYTLTVTGLQGHTLVPVMTVEIPQGTFHHFADGSEMKVEGGQLICSYPSTTFNNQWQAVYIDALNPLPGKRTYYARIYLVDMTLGRQIAQSNYFSFTNTGKQQQTQQQSKSQQQTGQQAQRQIQQKKTNNHLMFQGIPMGQSGASIKAALKQKVFQAGEYNMSGTLSGAPVTVWIADDGSIIRVSEEKDNTKPLAKKRFLQLKTQLMETYHGKVYPMEMSDGGDGAIISTDRGYIEVFYRDADEVDF